jgi:hypothetical protein
MIDDNNALIMELWSRIKSHIQPKERFEVADILADVFDEFGLLDDSLLGEDLDKELKAAAKCRLSDVEELEGFDDDDDGFGF